MEHERKMILENQLSDQLGTFQLTAEPSQDVFLFAFLQKVPFLFLLPHLSNDM